LKALIAVATQITAEISSSFSTARALAYSRSAVSWSGSVVVISASRSAARSCSENSSVSRQARSVASCLSVTPALTARR